ncbi:MAG: methyltransferase type 11 [Thermoleophilia bacterium]|nr:methyltransferase type 11 [Thermoleophilia bacterium]
MDLTEHAVRNRAQWNDWAAEYVPSGERHWTEPDPSWGLWSIAEADAGVLGEGGAGRFAGRDVVELGCGTAYVSSWLARAGAKVTGIDVSDEQLATARRLRAEHGFEDRIELIQGSGEDLPFDDASFDLAISEYGVCLWCDPYRWIPEAARVLRPGGELIFLTNGVLGLLCIDEPGLSTTTQLHRPLFGMHRMEWPDDDSVEFHLPHGEMIRLLGEHGLQVERLIELQAPEGATTRYTYADAAWAAKWPSEEVWVARKRP